MIYNYSFTDDNNYLLIFTNTKRVWRYNTKGDYWVLNLKTSKLQQLGKGLPASSLMFAKLSPDKKYAAYVSKNNIYLENLNTGKIEKLTTDGNDAIINGTTDWVYEEELQLRDAFKWSPDSKQIAFLQFDATGIGVYYMLNTTDSLYSKPIPVQYPKVGTKNSACKLGVVNISDKKIQWMNIEGDPRNNYIARLEWVPKTNKVMVQHLNRKQNKNEILFCDSHTGKIRKVFVDTDSAWLRVCDDVVWLNNGKEFTWISDKNGWQQIFRINSENGTAKEITPPEFDVVSISKIDLKNNIIYFIASPENATQRYLYKVDLDGKFDIQRITPKVPGVHSYSISDDAKLAIHNYSDFDTPTTYELISLPNHKTIKTFVTNKKIKDELKKFNFRKVEFFKVDVGDEILDGWMIKPNDFDPLKKYPVLFYVYGEPASQTVMDRFSLSSYLWYHMIANKGYIIISVDNRGTPAPRGHDFRKSVYGKLGILNAADQANAAKRIIEKYPFVDKDRIGVWGWSGGGSMTLNLMFQYPEIYSVGMSVAPVSNQRYYDTIYQERYMGLWPENKEAFIKGSPVTYAKNLKGKLLLVHGTGDDNVHYQNSEAVINELVKYNKQFTMFAYPNRSHGIYEGMGTRFHLYTLLTNFLYNNLEAGAK